MAMRRKRITLTNVLSQMDSRIRATELRRVSTTAGSSVESLSTTSTAANLGTVVTDSAPCDFIRITGGKYFSKRVTGETDRVELYIESDTGAYSDDTISVYGVRDPYNFSGDFVLLQSTPTGEDRPAWMGSLPSGVTTSIVYSTGQDIPISTAEDLVTRYEIQSYSTNGTTTDALITFTTDHSFAVGDVINASDLPSPYPGLDGAFAITAVTNNTITYQFTAELADPINESTPGTTSYIYATTQKKVAVGDTWIDTSTSPNTTYYWNGIRWSTTQSSGGAGGEADTLAPADVTNVTSTTNAYTIDGGIPRSTVTLSWDAPTTNSDGTTLTDLAGYDVWVSYTEPALDGSNTWTEKTGLLSADTTAIISGLNQDVDVWFKIFAVDSSLNRSEGVVVTETTSIFALELNAPSTPSLTSKLGTITAKWDGKDSTGVRPPSSIRLLEVHAYPNNAGFTPNSDPLSASYSLKGTMLANAAEGYFVITGLDYESVPGTAIDWYVKFVAVDVNGNKSAASGTRYIQISRVVGDDIVAGTITANEIDAGSIGAELISASVLRANNVSNSAGIEFTSDYIRAYSNNGANNNFRMWAANGLVQIGEGTQISGNSITTGTINASTVEVKNINASYITSGTINANVITVSNLNADNITSGTISAASFKTVGAANNGRGIHIDNANNSVTYTKSNGTGTGHMVSWAEDGVMIHYGSTPDSNGDSYPLLQIGSTGIEAISNTGGASGGSSLLVGSSNAHLNTAGVLSLGGLLYTPTLIQLYSPTKISNYTDNFGVGPGDEVSGFTNGYAPMRFQDGHLILGSNSVFAITSTTDTGARINSDSGAAVFFTASSAALIAGRGQGTASSDVGGTVMSIRYKGSESGTISVNNSGTVSYNTFMGSHYVEISEQPPVRGTIMESIDELVSGSYASQERLPKAKISDTPGSSAVYGVYFSEEIKDDEPSTGHLLAGLGASWIRIAPSVIVSIGDLIESNGDGCGRVQSDTVIRSSTVGKITSTQRVETYEDGSYLVPCVLYCG